MRINVYINEHIAYLRSMDTRHPPDLSLLEEHLARMRAPENGRGILRGIFSDINGTLVTMRHGEYDVDPDLAAFLSLVQEAGGHVQLLSTVEDNALVTGTGLTRIFGDVHAKASYRGRLEIVIDDSIMNLPDAVTHWDPEDPRVRRLVRDLIRHPEFLQKLAAPVPVPTPRCEPAQATI